MLCIKALFFNISYEIMVLGGVMRMDILLDNRCHMGAFFVLWPLLTHQPDQSLGASDTTEEENPRETEDRLKEFKEKEVREKWIFDFINSSFSVCNCFRNNLATTPGVPKMTRFN